MGLDFDSYVLAFLSLDLLFTVSCQLDFLFDKWTFYLTFKWQPHWALDRLSLPCQGLNVYTDWVPFLEEVATWMTERFKLRYTPSGKRRGNANGQSLATTAIRNSDTFCGMGVYTVNEVFFLAGMFGNVLSLSGFLLILFLRVIGVFDRRGTFHLSLTCCSFV